MHKYLGSNWTWILFQMQLFACLIFFSLDLCLHFLVLFLFCHPYLISSLFWNCLLETNGLSNYIGWITCLSKHLDKLEKKNLLQKKKDNDIISAYLHVPLCLFPDTFFIFVQRWSNKWQARILMRFKAFKKSFQNEKILLHYFFAFTNEASN